MTFIHQFVDAPKLKRVTDSAGARRYMTPNGDAYESVTTYLDRCMSKKALIAWKKKVGTVKAAQISKAATDRGTSLHKIVESYVMNEPLDFLDNFISKQRFLKIRGPLDNLNNIRLVETPLYSDELQLAGTPDIIAEYTGELAVIDAKTSTKVKKKQWIVSYFLQAASYGVMYQELFREPVKLAVIIMATEALNQPQVFIEPMANCIGMLRNFRKDPELFQKRMEMYAP